MKRKIIALLFLLMGCTFLNAAPYSEKIKELLVRLDSLIAQKNTFAMLKEAKIAQLHKLRKDVRTLEERYWLNKNLYDEYCVYNADSAMNYVAGNLDIVYKQNDKYRQMEWKIKKSFLLAATGLLKEAQDELDGVSGGSLPKELLVDYYGQMLYLYSHFNQYTGSEMGTLHEHYAQLERVYKDSLNMVLTPEDPLFLWYKGQVVQGTDSMYVFKERLQKGILNSAFDTRRDAMNAYVLACFYRESDEQENYLTYLIYSAMADVRISNKDIASLEELAGVLFSLGIGVLICFLGGLMAVDIAPRNASGAALGVVGIASYIGAGLQDVMSGVLIEGQKTVQNGVDVYDFTYINWFWIGAALLSVFFALLVWNVKPK